MKFRLPTFIVILLFFGSMVGMVISLYAFQTTQEEVMALRTQEIIGKAMDDAVSFIQATNKSHKDVLSSYANNPELLRAVNDADEKTVISIILQLFSVDRIFSSNILYINRGEQTNWLNLNALRIANIDEKQVRYVEQKSPAVATRILNKSPEINQEPTLLFSRYIGDKGQVTASIRMGVPLSDQSQFLTQLSDSIGANCLMLINHSELLSQIGDPSCLSQTGNLAASAGRQNASDLQGSKLYFSRPIDNAIGFEQARLIVGMQVPSIGIITDLFIDSMIYVFLGIITALILAYWLTNRLVGNSVGELLRYISQAPEHGNTDLKTGMVTEFNTIGVSFQKVFAQLREQYERTRKAESDVRNMNLALEERVKARTRELSHQTRLHRQKSEILETVLRSINQSVSYFDHNDNLMASNIGDTVPPALQSVLKIPHQTAEEMISALAEVGETAAEVAITQQAINSDKPAGLDSYVVEVTDRDHSWHIQNILLDKGNKAVVCTDLSDIKKAQQSLARADKMRALGGLVGGIAHDFNNLLTGIMGNTALLRVNSHSELDTRHLNGIDQAAQSAANLVKQLLNFAREEQVDSSKVSLSEVLEEFQLFVPRSMGPHIVIHTDVKAEYFVQVNRDSLKTSLLNLCVNARDAMSGEGQISICIDQADLSDITRANLPHSADFVAIKVIDQGTGIASSIQNRVFDPFFTTKVKDRGTGLGLSLVYAFANQSGGAVFFDSESDHGTTFCLLLPIVNCEKDELGPEAEPENIQLNKFCRILLVDDEPEVLHALKGMIDVMGGTTELAMTVGEAKKTIDQFDPHYFDIAICDIHLKDGKGFDVARHIKKRNPAIPILFISGNARLQDELEEESRLGELSLDKPFSIGDLCDAINSLIRQ